MTTIAPSPSLRAALEDLARRYDASWLASDPLAWPRRFEDPADREVVAVIAALLAYGRVATIQRSIGAVLEALAPRPAATIDVMRPAALARRPRGFRHRWTDGSDVAWILAGLARTRRDTGSLGALVAAAATGDEPLRRGLAAWRASLANGKGTATRRRARAFLLPDPFGGGACKRLLMLARWCVRGDDGLDLGLWRGSALTPAHLVMPLDVHVHAVARQLGLTARPRADWRAAVEVTANLARIDPEDPVRFDFALARPGITGRCRHRYEETVCPSCDLRRVCSAAATT